MSADIGEDAECHAAKLLEVIILQCPGQVDHASYQKLFNTSILQCQGQVDCAGLVYLCVNEIDLLLINDQNFYEGLTIKSKEMQYVCQRFKDTDVKMFF